MRFSLLTLMLGIGLSALTASAATYNGNGSTGFGGTLGNGSLSITSDSSNITFTFNPSGGFGSNDVVLYIDSVAGGFANTGSFSDNGDGGRTAISSTNNGNGGRSLITFPSGFAADYALEFENNIYTGLFGLVAGGNNALNYVNGASPTSGGPYTVTLPLSNLGLTAGQGFKFVGDLISTDAYGSSELLGTGVATDGTTPGNNPGYNGSITFSAPLTYSVPEPASLSVIGLASLAGLRRRRA